MRPHLQTNQSKWTEGMAQVVEYLLCKCEALSSCHQSPLIRGEAHGDGVYAPAWSKHNICLKDLRGAC
jgi:hypothetical protein